MKKYKFIYIFPVLLSLLFMACGDGDGDGSADNKTRRTIMVYFNAENNLYSAAKQDLDEIVTGSLSLASDCNLLVYYDVMTKPVIYKITNGKKEIVKSYDTDIDSSDPDNILSVFQTMMALSPAEEYATVFWGHGDGPIIANGTSSSLYSLNIDITDSNPNSYGADYNSNNENRTSNATWIDIPQLASVMRQLPKQEFIFFDACCMQSIEVAYELRDCTKYLIGATCETPSFGAPYGQLIPVLGSSTADIPQSVIDTYIDSNSWTYNFSGACLSAIATDKLPALLDATKSALSTLEANSRVELTTVPKESTAEPAATSCIFYFKTGSSKYGDPILYDMNDVMKANLSEDAYSTWHEAFDDAVVYARCPEDIRTTGKHDWIGSNYDSPLNTTDFRSFYIPSTDYKCVSFIMPKTEYRISTYPNMNTRMYDYEWCREVGWKDLGW